MYFGLNKFIKDLLPKQLFYRALLIVALPIIILQLTISIVFFDSLWIKANKGMTRSLVGEVKTLIEVYKNEKGDNQVSWYLKSMDYKSVPSGVYIVKVKTSNELSIKKITYLK